MKTVYLALVAGILAMILPTFAGISWGWTILPGIMVGVAVFVVVNRKYGKLVEAILQDATRELQTAQAMVTRAQSQQNAQAMKVAQKTMEKKSAQAVEKLKKSDVKARLKHWKRNCEYTKSNGNVKGNTSESNGKAWAKHLEFRGKV